MSRDEFRSLTPREFDALRVQYEESLKRNSEMVELMLAQAIAKIHNVSPFGFKHPAEMKDYMPSHWAALAKEKTSRPKLSKKKQNDALTDQIRTTMTALMGFAGVPLQPQQPPPNA